MTVTAVEIRLLGDPLVVVVDGDERPVTRPREQAVLARLSLSAPAAVPIETLVEDVWGQSPPGTVVEALRVHISNLRRAISGGVRPPEEVLVTSSGAYRLELDREAIDLHRLERTVLERNDRALRTPLELWSDQDLARFDTGSGVFTAAAQHLSELRAAGSEILAEVDLVAGHHDAAASNLQALLRREPYREHAWELLIRALDAAGRRTDALRAAQRARDALGAVGMEPGAALVAAEAAVLHREHDATLHLRASEYVDVGGSRVAFRTLGSHGPDLLFMHGGFVPFEVMPDEPRFSRFLGKLASRHRLILLDRRGIGMSDPPADGAAVTLDHWVADCSTVLDAVGSQHCLVLAHENGGPVALRLAAEQPQRIRGLVLHSTVAKYLRSDDHPYGPSEDAWDRIERMIDRLPGADDMLTMVAPSVGDDPGLRAWLDRAGRLGAGPARAKDLHRIYLDVDVRHLLDRIQAPTIVLQPARRVGSDPGQARYIAQQLPDAELQLLDSGDHLPFLADADTVLDAVARIAQRAAGLSDAVSKVLRALVGVAPDVGIDVIGQHRPEICLEVGGTLVAVFSSRTAAERCAADLTQRHPAATVVVQVDDTLATAEDDAVVAVADAVRRRHR